MPAYKITPEQVDQLEAAFTDAVHAGLLAWQRELLRGVTADTVRLIEQRVGDLSLRQPLRDALVDWLTRIADAGVAQARLDFERDVYGVKRTNEDALLTTMWDLANEAAARWAIRYGDNLMGALAKTTTPRIQALVADWIQNAEPLSALIKRIKDGPLYSYERARTIAVTETTRAFAQGNIEAWRASGVVRQHEWVTSVDERVCPICGPLHGRIVEIGQDFAPGISAPPAHPRCRCGLNPVVDVSS